MRIASLWPTLLLAPLLAHGATADDPGQVLAKQRAKEALETSSTLRGAAPLIELHQLRGSIEDLGLLVQVDEKIANDGKADPYVRTLAQELELTVQQAAGHDQQVANLTQKLGFVRDFYVLGGFDNDGKSGCDTDFGPEKALDLSAKYASKGATLTWHKLSETARTGYVDLSATLRPNQAAVGYALTFLKSDRPREVTLGLGTSGGYRLWVNGQLASKSDRYNEPRSDQNRFTVNLRPGLNRVLLKVCQEHGLFGFLMREEPTASGAIPAQVALPETLPVLGPTERGTQSRVLPTLADAMAKLVAAHPNDPKLLGEQAVVLSQLRTFDEKDHAAASIAAHAAQLAPKDVELQLLAGSLETRDINVRRDFFQAALKAEPNNPRALVAMGEQELAQDHSDQAREIALKALSAAPGDANARLLLSRAIEDLGDLPGAVAQVEEALREHPRNPEVVHAAIHVSRRLNRPKEALERMRVAAVLRSDDPGQSAAMAGFLADLGQTDDALRILQRTVKRFPFDNTARVRLAELLCANGQVEPGLKAFADARALAPDEPDLYAREGQALLSASFKQRALGSFEKALALRPQNPEMKEIVRSLKGDEGALGEQYVFDVKSLLKDADSYVGEDVVTLADYTYVRVQPTGLSARFHQLAVKVYTDRGVNAYRSYPITYSPDRQEVRVIRARITKPDGSVVESYGDADRNINDPSISMYYDTRAKMLSFPGLEKGDVLELEYRLEDTAAENLLSDYFGDVEYVQGVSPKVRFQYMVEMPQGRPLYWDQKRVGPGITEKSEPQPNGRVLYSWRAHDVSKINPEPAMPGWAEVASTLHVSTYQTWDQVAQYFWGLVRDQLTPNDELKKTVDQVLAKVDRNDTQAVVKAIYDFVVTNTRYVALEFGIHGYKPYRVDQVLSRRFGDCKDKASLITAMLKVAGVDADMVLLRMRNLGSIGETPASLAPFNHAIAYVPKLDLFLDGTAEFHGASELPWVDHVANALIVDPSGHGKFVTTPEVATTANQNVMSLEVSLKKDGSADVKGQSEVIGENAPEYRRSYQAAATRKANFEQGWAQTFPGLTVSALNVSEPSALEQNVKLDYGFHVPRYGESDGSSLRFYPFGSTRGYVQSFASLSERKHDLVMSAPWENHFTFRYVVPVGMAASALPPEAKEESPFGRYALKCGQDGAKISCEGMVALSVDRVKASDYPAFRAFLGRLDQAFGRKITLTALPTQASAKQ